MIIILFLLALAAAQEIDPDIQKNAESIFGTPDKPLVSTSDVPSTTENDIVKKNILELFGTAPPDSIDDKSPTEWKEPVTPKATSAPVTVRTSTEFVLHPSPEVRVENETCVRTIDNRTGVCVPYYLCDPVTKKLITDGENVIDVRIKECQHYLDVCCLAEDVNTTSPSPTTPAPSHGCGYSNFGDEEAFRIQNDGTKAEFLEYPWMIALLRRTEPGVAWSQKDFLGGGSLIHPNVVLTAAHKIDGMSADEIKCRAGEWDTQTISEVYPYQERNVKKVIRHEHFYRPSVLNSVALLVLESQYDPSPNIGIACLSTTPPRPSTRCFGMGWGREDFNSEGKYASILKKVEVPLVSRATCQNALRGTRLGSFFMLHQSLTCAGGEEGRDTCGGDGGSPLVCPIGDEQDLRYAIYGMVAYGIGCGEAGVPGVYVNTPTFYSWIGDKMAAEGFKTDTYKFKEQ